ncbi:MAG: competence/damage-inducible protein A [Alphaproteobacteria bacterium]|nr:competence/damage-inducible protein A [Alphaproteobacteria bacterium]
MAGKIVTACMIVIGNEILSGRTKDANLAYIAGQLTTLGVRLLEARVIPDVEAVVVATVNECRRNFDYVFTSGGIGPTHDDITAECIAKAFGRKLVRDPRALAIMIPYYQANNRELNEARLKMADLPEGSELILNPVSSAPGFRVENVYVMAGVPSIFRAMFDSIRHELAGGDPVHSITIAAYVPEGTIAGPLKALAEQNAALDIGSYPFNRAGRIGASLVLRGTDVARLEATAAELRAIIRSFGVEPEEEGSTV